MVNIIKRKLKLYGFKVYFFTILGLIVDFISLKLIELYL